MFVSIEQIEQSLGRLEQVHPFFGMSFLVFKRQEIPIGTTEEFVFARAAADLLETYYKASETYEGYYNPFQPSSVKSRWVARGYNHQSLQRITTDTFGDVTIHPKNTSQWGWRDDYVKKLKGHLGDARVPAFDLAVWLYRANVWPSSVQPKQLTDKLIEDFYFTQAEIEELFDLSVPTLADPWLSKSPVTERQLLRVIGFPPGATPEEGAALEQLELRAVGPASHLDYRPAERLNIITGDNSLGKTFLLECIWWALTGGWLERPAYPRSRNGNARPTISFSIKTAEGTAQRYRSQFDWETRDWTTPQNRKVLAGLVIYARHDGSFAIWDPAKVRLAESLPLASVPWVLLDKKGLWHGVKVESRLGEQWLCNGLLRDWVQWQLGGPRYEAQFAALTTCLYRLSPSPAEPLTPGNPSRWFPLDSRETPTLIMPYGEIPIQLASAGVQRIVAVAYVLVWAWFEHLENSRAIRKRPQRRLVFLIDEVEAHLHPRWQRVIVPALTDVINLLSQEITPQVHLATHSPMVMASTETIFAEQIDDLHHLRLVDADVELEELPFVKRGTVDQWLISNVFELRQARSVPAEEAIEAAKALQANDSPDPEIVREVNQRLVETLAPDDDFWPRWRFFARQHGHAR
jgi:hypothetical protein